MLLNMINYLKGFVKDERGQGMVEYGLILALVAIAVVATLGLIGGQLDVHFQNILAKLGGGGTP